MPRIMKCWIVVGLAIMWAESLPSYAFGQAVAFTPTVGMAPNGSTMTVTPAVTADRRYVRLSVNPYFNVVNGFTSFNTPLGAVSGSGRGGLGGGAGGGGLGGGGGGLGALGGGFRSVEGFDVAGGTFNAGMNGVVGPAGLESVVINTPGGFAGGAGDLGAGAMPYDGGYFYGSFISPTPGWPGWQDGGLAAARHYPATVAIPPSNSSSRSTRTAAVKKTEPSPSDTVRKSVSRRRAVSARGPAEKDERRRTRGQAEETRLTGDDSLANPPCGIRTVSLWPSRQSGSRQGNRQRDRGRRLSPTLAIGLLRVEVFDQRHLVAVLL